MASAPTSTRATRELAAQLAAQVLQGRGNIGYLGPRLASLVVFFENYLDEGISEVVATMGLLVDEEDETRAYRVVAGGALRAKADDDIA